MLEEGRPDEADRGEDGVTAVRSVAFEPTMRAPRDARDWIAWVAEYLDEPEAYDLQIVVSELVTNAVLHAGLAPDERIRVDAIVYGDRIAVTVTDGGRGIPPDASRELPPQSSASRRGLYLADFLTQRLLIDGPAGRVSFEMPRGTAAG